MKRLSASLILGFSILSFCFAQQTGKASYNPSKKGFHISHSSLSFNTHVRVTNLLNSRSVEAVVNGRIPIDSERIADISQEAGDALEMNKSGMTLVLIETLPPRVNPASPPVEAPPVRDTAPEPVPPPPVQAQAAPAPVQQAQTPPPPQILPVQTITDIQYVPVQAAPSCAPSLLLVILVLLFLVIILLVVILLLLLRRLPFWPWYPLWLRRYHRYAKKRGKV
jgi:hypothetical protein